MNNTTAAQNSIDLEDANDRMEKAALHERIQQQNCSFFLFFLNKNLK